MSDSPKPLPSPTPAICCRGVVKHLGWRRFRTEVLHGLDLDVFAGEMTLLVGPSGCGKTTLISTIAGILRPEAGSIALFGTALNGLGKRRLTRFRGRSVGLVLQQFNLFPALTAAENVAVPLLVLRHGTKAAYACAESLLDGLGLAAHAGKYPRELSVGEQQRVAIARAIAHEPRLIICDEPTAALDAASGRLVMQLLRQSTVRDDRAVLVVTHDHRIFPFADRIVHMDDGRITRVDVSPQREAA
jgi:putative ABC transport system ATP-binding protein